MNFPRRYLRPFPPSNFFNIGLVKRGVCPTYRWSTKILFLDQRAPENDLISKYQQLRCDITISRVSRSEEELHLESNFRVYLLTYVIVFNRYYDARAMKVSMSVLKNNTTSVYTRDKLMCVRINFNLVLRLTYGDTSQTPNVLAKQ